MRSKPSCKQTTLHQQFPAPSRRQRLLALGTIATLIVPPGCQSDDASPATNTVQSAVLNSTARFMLPGGGAVTDRGAATYSLPLSVPDGPQGMQPALTISYGGSAAGNGRLGVGFGLAGVSTISPCNKTFASEGFADGADHAIQRPEHPSEAYTSDAYCLDGQKLVADNSPLLLPDGGSRPTFLPDGSSQAFHTETETFEHIVAWRRDASQQPSKFVAYDRNGGKRVYLPLFGASTTNTDAYSTPSITNGSIAITYRIDEAFDRNGNKIKYTYERDEVAETNDVSSRIARIDYSYGGNTIAKRSVKFIYGRRNDALIQYVHGVRVVTTTRLDRIEMWAPGETTTAGNPGTIKVWQYNLSYQYSKDTDRSSLAKIQLCDPTNTQCSYARSFGWTTSVDTSVKFYTDTDIDPDTNNPEFDDKAMGYDPSSLHDYNNVSESNWVPPNDTRLMLFDIDGDGDDDALYRTRPSKIEAPGPNGGFDDMKVSAGKLKIRLSGKAQPLDMKSIDVSELLEPGLKAAALDSMNPTTAEDNQFAMIDLGKTRVSDFNGDGHPDLMLARTFVDQTKRVIVGQNELPKSTIYEWQYGFTTYNGHRWNHTSGTPFENSKRMALDDVSMFGPVFRGTIADGPSGSIWSSDMKFWYRTPPFQRVLADLDGDGRSDIVDPFYQKNIDVVALGGGGDAFLGIDWDNPGSYNGSVGWNYEAALTTAPNQPPVKFTSNGITARLACGNGKAIATDVDGDGRQDVLLAGDASFGAPNDPTLGVGTYLQLGLADGFSESEPPATPLLPHGQGKLDQTSKLWVGDCKGASPDFVMGDWNGDGLPDALYLPGSYTDGTIAPNTVALVRWNLGTGFSKAVPMPVDDSAGLAALLEQKVPVGKNGDPVAWDRGTRIADIDGDGRSDIIAIRQNIEQCVTDVIDAAVFPLNPLPPPCYSDIVVFRSRGDRFSAEKVYSPLGAGNLAQGFTTAQLGDVTGDGALDFAFVSQGHLASIELPWRTKPDLLNIVADEGTNVPLETFTHDRAWWGKGDRPEATAADPFGPSVCGYPTPCPKRGTTVVTQHKVFAGTRFAGTPMYRTTLHKFDGMRASQLGRGSLGFANHQIWERERGRWTERSFDNATAIDPQPMGFGGIFYPFASVPSWETTVTPRKEMPSATDEATASPHPGLAAGTYLTRTVASHHVYETSSLHAAGQILRLFPKTSTTRVNDENTQLAITNSFPNFVGTAFNVAGPTTETTSTYGDNFGNLTAQRTTVRAGLGPVQVERELVATYENRTATSWQLGLKEYAANRTFNSDAASRPSQVERATFDTKGRVLTAEIRSTLLPTCTGGACEKLENKTTYTYDGFGNQTASSVVAGSSTRTTSATYPGEGVYPATTTDPLGFITTTTVHPWLGLPVSVVDINGLSTVLDYDRFGRLRSMVRSGGNSLVRAYAESISNNQRGVKVSDEWSNGAKSYFRTDEFGRATESGNLTLGPDPWAYGQTQFDSVGNVVKVMVPAASFAAPMWSLTTFDRIGTKVLHLAANGATTNYTTSVSKLTERDPAGDESFIDLDVAGRTKMSGHLRAGTPYGEVSFTYGPFDHVATVTDAAGNIATINRDPFGRILDETDPDTGTRSFLHNGFGETTRRTDAEGTIQWTYDAAGREATRTAPEGITTRTYDIGTKGKGKISSVISPDDVRTSYAYDSYGRPYSVTQTIDGTSDSMIYRYDSFGQVRYLFYPTTPGYNRFTVAHQYVNGELKSLSNVSSCGISTAENGAIPSTCFGAVLWRANARNSRGQLTDATYGGSLQDKRTYYPETGQLATQITPAGATSYDYRIDGLLAKRTENGREESYDHDEVDRLTKWTLRKASAGALPTLVTDYTYDEIGNLSQIRANNSTTFSGTYNWNNRPHALASSSLGFSYVYDGAGRQTSGAGRTIAYNSFNLPTTITTNTDETFDYDGNGQRARRYSTLRGGVRYLGRSYEHRTPQFADDSHVFYVQATDGPVAQVEYRPSGNRTRFVVSDRLGTATTFDGAGVVEQAYFDPFGGRVDANGAAVVDADRSTTRGFTGHEEDSNNLINMQGRIYDRNQYRFITPDPIIGNALFGQTYNPYSYVYNNPVNLNDPTGFEGADADQPVISPDVHIAENGTYIFAEDPIIGHVETISTDGGEPVTPTTAPEPTHDPLPPVREAKEFRLPSALDGLGASAWRTASESSEATSTRVLAGAGYAVIWYVQTMETFSNPMTPFISAYNDIGVSAFNAGQHGARADALDDAGRSDESIDETIATVVDGGQAALGALPHVQSLGAVAKMSKNSYTSTATQYLYAIYKTDQKRGRYLYKYGTTWNPFKRYGKSGFYKIFDSDAEMEIIDAGDVKHIRHTEQRLIKAYTWINNKRPDGNPVDH